MASRASGRRFTPNSFGRYIQFAQRYGIAGSVRYFLNTSWFDWRTGLDTAHSVAVADLNPESATRGDEVEYLPSWTVTVKKAFAVLRDVLGAPALAHTFVDVGAGKGKVCVVWARELRNAGLSGVIVRGVDISAKLCQIARDNVARAGLSQQVHIDEHDAARLRFDGDERVVLWLYNPFGEVTLGKLLGNIRGQVEAIIYCNPVGHDTVVAGGYAVKYQEKRWHPNLSFTLYVPLPEPSRH